MKRLANRKEVRPTSSEHWYRKIAGTAVAAGAGVLATPSDANAQIVVYTPNVSTTGTTGISSIFFDFHTGTAQNNHFAGEQFYVLRSNNGARNAAFFYAEGPQNHVIGHQATLPGGIYQYPGKLAAGAPIGAAGPWLVQVPPFSMTLAIQHPPNGFGDWYPVPSGPAFLGLRFSDDGGVNYNYGWAELTIAADYNMTLSRFAYDTVLNEQILAGQTSSVPEPSSAVLLVLGAAGMAAYRRQRRQLAESSSNPTTTA